MLLVTNAEGAAEGLVVRHIGRGTFVAKLGEDGKPIETTGKPSRRFTSLAPARAERRERFDRELGDALAENGAARCVLGRAGIRSASGSMTN